MNKIEASVWIADVQKLIDAESRAIELKKTVPFSPGALPKDFDFTNYHHYDDITAFIKSVATTYPDFVSLFDIGKSVEGRVIYGLKIGKPGTNKHGFYVDAGIHAREWIAPAVAVWVINELTANYATNQKYVDQLDWYIIPSVNPDGYEYSWKSDRLWRKNRSTGRVCSGVDLNRNFPFHWGEAGVSNNQCSEIFCGKSALSEPESKAMATYITSIKDKVQAMITLHSYSEDYLVPYGYVVPAVYPPDYDELLDAAQKASEAGAKETGVKYAAVNSAAGLYAASGASDDWSKNLGIKYVYTIETRPDADASNGFVLDPSQIVPSAREIWAGFKVIADRVIALP
jgi:murein tripeptide amidase MpaA